MDLGWVSFGLKMEGTVDGEDGKFDAERNRISVSVKCGKSFNACAEGIVPRNVKTSFAACIDSTSQRGVKLSPKMFDRICRSGGVVEVAGKSIAIDVDNPDEGCGWSRTGRLPRSARWRSRMRRFAIFGSTPFRRPGSTISFWPAATIVRRRLW